MYLSTDTPEQVQNADIQRDYYLNVLAILWDPLPTLDLTDIDPDIVYTVELFKIICDQNISISHTVVTESNATIENLDFMQIYKVVITARNNVREARNGPRVEIRGISMQLK